MSSPKLFERSFDKTPTIHDDESGYASGSSSHDSFPEVYFTKPHLKYLNSQLQHLEPEEILRWCLTSLPGLYQTTAFGLTGLVTVDILSKINGPLKSNVDLIFLDTLHHFQETLELVERVKKQYGSTVHIYKPAGVESAKEFSQKYGEKLWETNDNLYDYIVKVEPSRRAYSDLQVKAVLTGRRRSQGGKRGDIDILEVDDNGVIKVNPLANWSFKQVQEYVDANNVPYNELLKKGYKSVGDWHSTQPVAQGEDERSGRWKGKDKTECGLHNPASKYAQYLMQLEAKKQEEALNQAIQKMSVAA